MGHARALLSLDKPSQQLKLYNETVRRGLSVRQVEQLVKQQQAANAGQAPSDAPARLKSDTYRALQSHLSDTFGVKVRFSCDITGKGKITLPFKTEQELDHIIEVLDTLKDKA